MIDRDRDTESISSSNLNEPVASSSQSINSINTLADSTNSSQPSIDLLFERGGEKSAWEPVKTPTVLGELLDSRHMLPLLLPSDPRLLAAMPGPLPSADDDKPPHSAALVPESRSTSRASSRSRGALSWRSKDRKIRQLDLTTLQRIDGTASVIRWTRRPVEEEEEDEDEEEEQQEQEQTRSHSSHEGSEEHEEPVRLATQFTPLARKASTRKGRASHGGGDVSPIEEDQ